MADPIPFSFKCDARWDDMLGGGAKRLCTRCNTPVVDLSSMTEAEAHKVLQTPGVCVNYLVKGGKVVYGRKQRGGVDAEASALRREARRRGRGRRLLRWASAAASVAAAGGVLLPGVAYAGATSADDGAIDSFLNWVGGWLQEAEPIRLGGAPMVPEPEPEPEPTDTGVEEPAPRRHGGKPQIRYAGPGVRVLVDTGAMELTHVELTCDDGSRTRTFPSNGTAYLKVRPQGAVTCHVTVPTAPPQRVTLDLEPHSETHCAIDDGQLTCR